MKKVLLSESFYTKIPNGGGYIQGRLSFDIHPAFGGDVRIAVQQDEWKPTVTIMMPYSKFRDFILATAQQVEDPL
jgi:hypothetical protein